MAKLADWAFGRPGAVALKAAGYSGVIRYLSSDQDKNLDYFELAEYTRNGMTVSVVFENGAGNAGKGFKQGTADAGKALSVLGTLVRNATDCPIYFAVDFDPLTTGTAPILDYFRGILSVIHGDKVGVYGAASVVSEVANLGVKYLWQTRAWSHGMVAQRIGLLQTTTQEKVNGVTVDLNTILTNEIGVINVGYADDQLGKLVNSVPGLNPSEFSTIIPLIVTRVRGLVDQVTALSVAVGKLASSQSDTLQAVRDIGLDLESQTPGTIDYDKLARALLNAIANPEGK